MPRATQPAGGRTTVQRLASLPAESVLLTAALHAQLFGKGEAGIAHGRGQPQPRLAGRVGVTTFAESNVSETALSEDLFQGNNSTEVKC